MVKGVLERECPSVPFNVGTWTLRAGRAAWRVCGLVRYAIVRLAEARAVCRRASARGGGGICSLIRRAPAGRARPLPPGREPRAELPCGGVGRVVQWLHLAVLELRVCVYVEKEAVERVGHETGESP